MPTYKTSCRTPRPTWTTTARGCGCSRPAHCSSRVVFSSCLGSHSLHQSGPTPAWSEPTSASPIKPTANRSERDTSKVTRAPANFYSYADTDQGGMEKNKHWCGDFQSGLMHILFVKARLDQVLSHWPHNSKLKLNVTEMMTFLFCWAAAS